MPQHGCAIRRPRFPRAAPLLAVLYTPAAREPPTPTASTSPVASQPDSLLVSRTLAAAARQSLGGPLPFLTPSEQQLFNRGNVVFQTVFTPATGLGPTFNDVGCAACHQSPVVGATGEDIETHATAFHNGVCDDLVAQGGPVIQDSVTPALKAALGLTKEPMPPAATGVGRRTTPLVLGFGLLDAVPDRELLALAQVERFSPDGIHGRPNRLAAGRIGRCRRQPK